MIATSFNRCNELGSCRACINAIIFIPIIRRIARIAFSTAIASRTFIWAFQLYINLMKNKIFTQFDPSRYCPFGQFMLIIKLVSNFGFIKNFNSFKFPLKLGIS